MEKTPLLDKGTCETFSYPHLFFEIPSGKPTMDFVRHKADSMTDWLAWMNGRPSQSFPEFQALPAKVEEKNMPKLLFQRSFWSERRRIVGSFV